jgi:Ca2+/Na+ antiporter
MDEMSDYIMIGLLTLAVYYPFTLGALALMMFFAWRRRASPYWRLALGLLALLFVLFAKAAYDWHRYN